jgi:diguanylate cyclase (GGDEF)-like protein/PAS domain S-box-containing protein
LFFAVVSANEWLGNPESTPSLRDREASVRAARFNLELDRVQGILARANKGVVRHILESNDYSDDQLATAKEALHRALADAGQESSAGEASEPQFDEIRTQADNWFAASQAILTRALTSPTPVKLDDPDVVVASGQLDTLEELCTELRLTEDTLVSARSRQTPPPSRGLRISLEAASLLLLCGVYLFIASRNVRHIEGLSSSRDDADFYRALFESSPLPALILDENGLDILSANRAAELKYGYSADELTSMNFAQIRNPAEAGRALEWWATSRYREGVPLDGGRWEHRRKNGSTFVASIHVARTSLAGRPAAFLVIADVSEQAQREQALRKTATLLEGVLDSLPQSIAWKDRNFTYLGANRTFMRSAGLTEKAQLIGPGATCLEENALLARSKGNDARVLEGLIALRGVEEAHPTEAEAWISRTQVPLLDASGNTIGIVDALEDITPRKRSELAMRLRLRALDASVNAILICRTTPTGNVIEYTNPAFAQMTGYTPEEALGRDCSFLHGTDCEQRGVHQIQDAVKKGSEVSAVLRNYRKDGSRFWNKLYFAPIRELGGNVTHYVGVLTDVTELIQYQQQLERQANFDTLTQLPNRSMLHGRLTSAIADAQRRGSSVAVFFLDLDLFKNINDSLGHGAGDRLLKSISKRLVGCVRDTDTVARYGGDEFVVVLPHPEGAELPGLLARILAAVSDPVFVDEHELYVEASIGVSRFPTDGDTPEILLKKADAAMYLAKERGRNNYQFYHHELDVEVNERLALSNRLRKAVRAEELTVHYQPQVDMRTGQILGVEALLRWTDPELGAISPATFIPLAEESGLIVKMGEFVLREACQQLKTWEAQGLPSVRVSVNVSPQQIFRSNVLLMVKTVLDETGVPPSSLELEMTETTLMTNAQDAARLLDSLQELGIHIAIDDFGTGYSSLSYLKKFSVDRIKIDRAFVRDIGEDGDNEIITRAVIALAKTLDVQVIAEGVETPQQRDFLLRHGCVEAQGFLYSPAVPPATLAHLLEESVGLEKALEA